MTKPEISFELRRALIAAAYTDTVDGPRGRALAVIRTGMDRGAKYVGRRHVVLVAGRYVPVSGAVDLANSILEQADLKKHRIDYPGSKYQSRRVGGANDNGPLHQAIRSDVAGGA